MNHSGNDQKTHFGYQEVSVNEKENLVRQVFNSVASKYDLMNDLMSFGIHRAWKLYFVSTSHIRPGDKVLDLAGGTGDITRLIKRKLGADGTIVLGDINAEMLSVAKNRFKAETGNVAIHFVECNAECLPFNDEEFDLVTIALGLRNVTHKDLAINEMLRVLKPGGQLRILEFSQVIHSWFRPIYDFHSFQVLPKLGKFFTGDPASYQYLAESIRKHPPQEELKRMMETAGFIKCSFENLSGGIVAIHTGYKS